MEIGKAQVQDVPAMVDIINSFAGQGQMLARSRHHVYQGLRDFVVARENGELIGCGALAIIWEDMGEIRSLAVAAGWQGKGVGRLIVETLVAEAKGLGLPRLFALTYRQAFFEHLGFQVAAKETLPHKIWGDCLNCPKFPNCDEIAMIRDLND